MLFFWEFCPKLVPFWEFCPKLVPFWEFCPKLVLFENSALNWCWDFWDFASTRTISAGLVALPAWQRGKYLRCTRCHLFHRWSDMHFKFLWISPSWPNRVERLDGQEGDMLCVISEPKWPFHADHHCHLWLHTLHRSSLLLYYLFRIWASVCVWRGPWLSPAKYCYFHLSKTP